MATSSSEMVKKKKSKQISFMKNKIFQDSQVILLADFRGLDMEKTTKLRNLCREKEIGYKVVKNTLARIASKDTAFEDIFSNNYGNTALAFSKDDPGSVAKLLTEFSKKEDFFVVKGGSLQNATLTREEIDSLAKLPTKNELFAKLLATFNAVPTSFVRVLNEVPASFLRLLVAYKDTKEQD